MTNTAAILWITVAPHPNNNNKRRGEVLRERERALDRKRQTDRGPYRRKCFCLTVLHTCCLAFLHLPVFCKRFMWLLWFIFCSVVHCAAACLPSCRPVWLNCFVVKLSVPTHVANGLRSSFQLAATCQQQSHRKWTAAGKVWMYPQATSIENIKQNDKSSMFHMTCEVDRALKSIYFPTYLLSKESFTHGLCFETMTVPASFAQFYRLMDINVFFWPTWKLWVYVIISVRALAEMACSDTFYFHAIFRYLLRIGCDANAFIRRRISW